MENLYHPGPTMRTISGIYINVLEPKAEHIEIYDIAHALSHQCRFAGHMKSFYSVAQHSIEVCEMVSKENRLAALLHDASEAYLVDVPRPVKHQLPDYKAIENNLMKAIAEKFGFQYPFSEEIKHADDSCLLQEWEQLVTEQKPRTLLILPIESAREMFLYLFRKLSYLSK